MKKTIQITLMLVMLAGCSKSTNQASQSQSSRKIFGAFGWQLGQTLPPTQEIYYGSDGKTTAHIDVKDYPPFESGALVMSKDGRVCTIEAWTTSEVSPQSVGALLTVLTNEYGPIKQHTIDASHENKQTWWIEDGYASIMFSLYGDGTINVLYHDDKLENPTGF